MYKFGKSYNPIFSKADMSLIMRKPIFVYAITKAQISCRVIWQLIRTFVFATEKQPGTRIDVYETLCPQQMLVHKGGNIKNWGGECRDVTPTKLQYQNIQRALQVFSKRINNNNYKPEDQWSCKRPPDYFPGINTTVKRKKGATSIFKML